MVQGRIKLCVRHLRGFALQYCVVVLRQPMKFTIEHEQVEDGRWLAAGPELPGVLAYGATAEEAMAKAEALALCV